MKGRRVVVTGLGMLTPLGNDVADCWSEICQGRSGIREISSFDVNSFSTRIGGCIENLDLSQYLTAKQARQMDTFVHYGIAAGVQAFDDSGLGDCVYNSDRFGVAVGSGIGGIAKIEETTLTLRDSGPRRVSPFFVPGSIINMISGHLSMRYGVRGPNIAVVTACTTGTHNIGLGANMIVMNQADIMLVGGAEMATTPVGLGGFCAARALSTRNDEPGRASRPWDRDRDGFVLSDGAAVMVLEEEAHARKRNARIYASLSGFGMSGDAYHMTSPSPGGEGAALCMRNALASAEMDAQSISYINAHGTSTKAGDIAETEAIKSVFGTHAHELCVSSSKSMIGHMLGAAGAAEAIISILTLHDQVIPPTINLENPDEECDLDYVPHCAREHPVNAVLSNSFGFGGTNGSLVFARYD